MSGHLTLSGSRACFDGCGTHAEHHDPAIMRAGGGSPQKNGWVMDDLGGSAVVSTLACWIGAIGIRLSGSLTQTISDVSNNFLSGPRAHWSEVGIDSE